MSAGSVCYTLSVTTQSVPPIIGLNTTHNVLVKISRSNTTVTVTPNTYTLTLTYSKLPTGKVFTFSKTYTVPTVTSYPYQTTVGVPISIPGADSGNYAITGATAVKFSDQVALVNAGVC